MALPLTRSRRFTPDTPEQEVTLSLHPPLRAFTPKNPSAEMTPLRHLSLRPFV
ncbi:hypothetical protein [uncultured Duncaniella sp.]|uniref:hypothetical protein n=1 Tax=uncultured Duncaniella sp. TaxID=2768039 RepID=UPI00261A3463|nr:hypothetical protein [uncultured Duncaniella sp.]